ncbi:unnamed protein product [Cylindrotheca closterium]|uniref:RING-type domain-containing protein n=1 Tax=Cylindrotheca closterium TaxID=2856 RepID=A0AAD2CB38_9STRA|nr:unnamed protein product [Cylindrotheca closterium]
MNSSTPTSGRAPMHFAVPPTTGSYDSSGAPSPPATQATTLEALHLAARQYNNNRVTRSHVRNPERPFRYSATGRMSAIMTPTRSVHTRSEAQVNAVTSSDASSDASSIETTPAPEVVQSRSKKRRAPESPSAAASQPTKTAPRKRARAKASNLKQPPPKASPGESSNDSSPEPAEVNCCICMCDAEPSNLASINGCEHQFCFGCIEKWAERENTCPLCKVRFSKIDRKNKKRKKGQKNTKKVKQRDQRSDLVSGAALEGLLANFASTQPPNLARFFLSSVGSLGSIDFHSRSFRSITIARGGGSGDNSDDDDNPIASLFRVYTNTLPPPLMPMMQPMSFASRFGASRSYASNSHDRTAGRGVENPLTIDDSDSDDDIVVLSSRRGAL